MTRPTVTNVFKRKIKSIDAFPPAMPYEGAYAWLRIHPLVNPDEFWADQVQKHRHQRNIWLGITIIFSLSFIFQAASIILKIVSGQYQ